MKRTGQNTCCACNFMRAGSHAQHWPLGPCTHHPPSNTPVAQRLGLLHAVRGEDHSALPPRPLDHVPQQLAGGGVQACRQAS